MVIAFLESRVGAEVGTTVPKPRPPLFLRAWRNGGPAANRVVDRPLVTLEAWSEDSTVAADLLSAARSALMNDYTAMPLVRGVREISGPYFTPDPESGTPRYRCSLQLTVRATRA